MVYEQLYCNNAEYFFDNAVKTIAGGYEGSILSSNYSSFEQSPWCSQKVNHPPIRWAGRVERSHARQWLQ